MLVTKKTMYQELCKILGVTDGIIIALNAEINKRKEDVEKTKDYFEDCFEQTNALASAVKTLTERVEKLEAKRTHKKKQTKVKKK